jgi:hypothetical protein
MRKPKHEIQRTCKRDGTKWYVPLDARKLKVKGGLLDRLDSANAGLRATGDRLAPGQWRGAGEMHLANSTRKKDRREDLARSYNTCPSCGSQSYSEKKVRI